MTGALRFTILCAVILYFILLFLLLKKRSLNIKYSLLWIFSGLLMLLLLLFPELLSGMARLTGTVVPTNMLFAVLFFCVIIILMSITAIVSKLKDQMKRMAQTIALLENRLRAESIDSDGNAD